MFMQSCIKVDFWYKYIFYISITLRNMEQKLLN